MVLCEGKIHERLLDIKLIMTLFSAFDMLANPQVEMQHLFETLPELQTTDRSILSRALVEGC